MLPAFPETFEDQKKYWQQNMQNISNLYATGKQTFLAFCMPSMAITLSSPQIIYLLSKRFGDEKVRFCLNPNNRYESPVASMPDSDWLKSVAMVGVNVRTIGSFWNVVKYGMTLPARQSSIHLLPIWECGVVDSLYAPASWQLNEEFFDKELQINFPHLNTTEKQLKVCTNFIHLMGKTIGLDVVPHTDRYSEMVLANPHYFEWLQRKGLEIVDHSSASVKKVKQIILDFVCENPAVGGEYFPRNTELFFNNEILNEELRLRLIVGKKEDKLARNGRRNELLNLFYAEGLEPAPATMAPPYRGLVVDTDPKAKTIDDEGRVWHDYKIAKPTQMSRVFGPLARYKFYETVDDTKSWDLDFDRPRPEVYNYVAAHYKDICDAYNFDFMRGDMSHVQMNPQPDYTQISPYYDIHKFVKNYIAQQKPYFAYFAESFLVEDNLMAYGSEAQHLNASDCDAALGNLQGYGFQDKEHWHEFCKYLNMADNESFKPNFTIFTGDKDDPRFDESFNQAAELRYFMHLFFAKLPSYTALGYEQRDQHIEPWANENYTKLYVFQIKEGNKATTGPYQWGKNGALYAKIHEINLLADEIFVENMNITCQINSNPTQIMQNNLLSWTLSINQTEYLIIANLKNQERLFPENKISAKKIFQLFGASSKLKPYDLAMYRL